MFPFVAQDEPVVPETSQMICCPICAGPLCELRGQCRCLRCQFTFCQSCESEAPDSDLPNG